MGSNAIAWVWRGGIAAGVVCAATAALAQEPVDRTETWSGNDLAGWSAARGVATLTNDHGCATARFAVQSAPIPESEILCMPLESGIRPTRMAFAFAAPGGVPSALRVCAHAAGGRLWQVNVSVAEPATEWRAYEVAADYAAGWRAGPGADAARFEEDFRNLDWIGVYLRRGGEPRCQTYRLDEFRVQGYALDSDGDGMSDLWERRHGLDPANAADGAADADGDGMSNRAEYRAGLDPRDAASRFWLQIERVVPDGESVHLRWRSVSNRTYAVSRADFLGGRFRPVARGLPATPPTNAYRDPSATNATVRFYRIEVEQPASVAQDEAAE
jgi:hypothetical protein